MMRRFLFFTVAILFGSVQFAFAQEMPKSRSFVHPGLLHTQADLDFMKKKIELGDEPWKTAWESLRHSDSVWCLGLVCSTICLSLGQVRARYKTVGLTRHFGAVVLT
jgi:hypothetical protein